MQARIAQLVQMSIFRERDVPRAIVDQQAGFVINKKRRHV
jgi:hypothetical protein